MYGYIYKTTNLINNKIYVGKKKSSKFLKESYMGSGVAINSAIEKYGRENFTVDIIDTANSLEELNNKEKMWIKLLNSRDSSIGYNIAYGGDGGCVWGDAENHPSKKTDRRKENNPFYGKHHTEESKLKVKDTWKSKLNDGYTAYSKNKVRIRKDGEIKYCLKDEIDRYIADGWKCSYKEELDKKKLRDSGELLPGMLGKNQTPHQKAIASMTHRGKIITEEQKEKFRSTWTAMSEDRKNEIHSRYSEIQKKLRWVVDKDNHAIRVHDYELEDYLKSGFIRGRKFK